MKNSVKHLIRFLGFRSRKYIDCCFERDAMIYSTNSGLQGDTTAVIGAKIRIICHTIEKALSLTDCRGDFGKQKIENLINLYNVYKDSVLPDKNTLDIAESTIRVYADHRKRHSLDSSWIPSSLIENDSTGIPCGAQMISADQTDFKEFCHIAESRHSIRNYSLRPIEHNDIINAVKIAQTAPSACNRQATRIYAITDSDKINALKQRHGGIRTFGMPSVIFVISQDLNLYISEYERNTWLVDGGIFCMNFLYALDSVGIVNCPVIWGGMDDEDTFLSELVGIPQNERVAVLVVGGYPPEHGVKAPCSPKRPVEDILQII
jgi:nitroreductase